MAAVAVFVWHVLELRSGQDGAWWLGWGGVFAPFWNGQAAVVLFFVLSGFVLALPYVGSQDSDPIHARPVDAGPFLVRRLFRLYPTYWVALALALGLRLTLFRPEGLAGLSVWINTIWDQPFPWPSLPRHLVLIWPGLDTYHLDPVVWSLSAEVKVSLIYPLVIVLLRRLRSAWWVAPLLAIFLIVDLRLHALGHLTLFLFGGLLARFRQPVLDVLAGRVWLRWALWPLAVALYGAHPLLPQLAPVALDQIAAAGAVLWIALFLTSRRLCRLGNSAPVHFLGQVSYSFYLMHLPVLMVVTGWCYPLFHGPGYRWPQPCALALVGGVGLAVSLGVAWLGYRMVELPTQSWGRRLARACTAWRAGSSGPATADCQPGAKRRLP